MIRLMSTFGVKRWSLVLVLWACVDGVVLEGSTLVPDDWATTTVIPEATTQDWSSNKHGDACNTTVGNFCELFSNLYCNPLSGRCECQPPKVYDHANDDCRNVYCYATCTHPDYLCIDEVCTECKNVGGHIFCGADLVTAAPDNDYNLSDFVLVAISIICVKMFLLFLYCIFRQRRHPFNQARTHPAVGQNNPMFSYRSDFTLSLPPNYPRVYQPAATVVNPSVKIAMNCDLPPTYMEALAQTNQMHVAAKP